ncbi:hypothetical protein Bpfe_000768, partial [Biomphalaria pfeifferi]
HQLPFETLYSDVHNQYELIVCCVQFSLAISQYTFVDIGPKSMTNCGNKNQSQQNEANGETVSLADEKKPFNTSEINSLPFSFNPP